MSEDQDEDYNVTHKAFLQALISKSTITFEEAQSILAAILTAHSESAISSEDIADDTSARGIQATGYHAGNI